MSLTSVSLPSSPPLPLHSLHFHLPSSPPLSVVAPVIVNLTASPSTGVSQGSPLNLRCEAVGGPTLNVTWTTPTEPRVGSFISVNNVTADNAGEYRCEVTSEAGTTNDSITIIGEEVLMGKGRVFGLQTYIRWLCVKSCSVTSIVLGCLTLRQVCFHLMISFDGSYSSSPWPLWLLSYALRETMQ